MPLREKSKQVARRRGHNCSHAHTFVVRETVQQVQFQAVPNVTGVVAKKRLSRKGKGVLVYVVSGASKSTTVVAF